MNCPENDQCRKCVVRGDIVKCLTTPCQQHNSWMVGELRKEIIKRGCSDLLCAVYNAVCQNCPISNKRVKP